MKQYYVILSIGAYSDYSPIYYVGDREITQEELTKKSEELGTQMWNEWIVLPEREEKYWNNQQYLQRYDPENPKKYINNSGPDDDEFMKEMEKWLNTQGFSQLPDAIPETNVYYDVPGKPTE